MWAGYSTVDPYYLGDDPEVEDGPDDDLADLDTAATLEEMLAVQPPIHCAACCCDRETVERDREYVYEQAVCCDAAPATKEAA